MHTHNTEIRCNLKCCSEPYKTKTPEDKTSRFVKFASNADHRIFFHETL